MKKEMNIPENENNSGLDINTDENLSGTTHLNEPVTEDPELEKLQSELGEQKDKYLRLVAEFENFKRRNARERIELIQTAGREVIADLLEVIDDFERAQKQLDENKIAEDATAGIGLIYTKLKHKLAAKGLRPMESLHEDFNPDLHEAITEIPAPSPELKGKVLDVLEKGYYLNDKIIRFAKVVVGK